MFTNLKLNQEDFYLVLWAVNHEKIARAWAAKNAVTEDYRRSQAEESARLAEIEKVLREKMSDMDEWHIEADVEVEETVEEV